MEPFTNETAELSPEPLVSSMPGFRPDTFCQSVVPNVVGLVARLPSPPAKVLPESGDEHDWVVPFAAKSQPLALSAKLAAGMARPMATVAAAVSIPHVRFARRIRRSRCPADVAPPGILDVLTFPSLGDSPYATGLVGPVLG